VLGLHRRLIQLDDLECAVLDVESVEGCCYTLETLRPDIVVHAAGLTSVERCEAEPDLAWHINTDLPEIVAKSCALSGVTLVHISTDHLFTGRSPFVMESEPVSPINVYGRTKAIAEERVIAACPRALVIRTNFFGWGPLYRQSFSDRILGALRAGRELGLFDDVYYTPVLAEVLAFAVHELLDRGAFGVFNVVGDERISKYEFGMKLADQFGLDGSLLKRESIAGRTNLVKRPSDMSLSNQKVRSLLGRALGSTEDQIARLVIQEAAESAREVREL
jgi:dTDP-4-dehydrorhamnose reductase